MDNFFLKQILKNNVFLSAQISKMYSVHLLQNKVFNGNEDINIIQRNTWQYIQTGNIFICRSCHYINGYC